MRAAVAAAVEHYGRIDTVFNNAGITGAQQILHEMDVENWDRVRAVNGDGVFYVMKYTIAAMLETGGGSVVNTSSTAAAAGRAAANDLGLQRTFATAGIDRPTWHPLEPRSQLRPGQRAALRTMPGIQPPTSPP